jgi:protein-tyrosine phosphatase
VKPVLFTIARAGPGRLSTMARPRGGDWLDEEMRALASSGVNAVVSLLTGGEMRELELEGEAGAAAAVGMNFIAFPVTDRGLPGRQALGQVVTGITSRLGHGQHVVAHCRYGIGRSSVLAAAVLVAEGLDAEEAWQRIAKARGRPVPDTEAQRAFVASLTRGGGEGPLHR